MLLTWLYAEGVVLVFTASVSVVPREPYYCNECLDEYERQGVVDVTLQRDLMKYLYNGTLPESLAA